LFIRGPERGSGFSPADRQIRARLPGTFAGMSVTEKSLIVSIGRFLSVAKFADVARCHG
jgi:hypothetical protein